MKKRRDINLDLDLEVDDPFVEPMPDDPNDAVDYYVDKKGVGYRVEVVDGPNGKEKIFIDRDGVSFTFSTEPFTGIARSCICFKNNGHSNFKLVTLAIENGIVISHKQSIPYASWEAIQQYEFGMHKALLNLNCEWEHGKALRK